MEVSQGPNWGCSVKEKNSQNMCRLTALKLHSALNHSSVQWFVLAKVPPAKNAHQSEIDFRTSFQTEKCKFNLVLFVGGSGTP
jgi:hypothetical protein